MSIFENIFKNEIIKNKQIFNAIELGIKYNISGIFFAHFEQHLEIMINIIYIPQKFEEAKTIIQFTYKTVNFQKTFN